MAVVTVLGVSAATWGLAMALAPVLQIRRMWQRRSSEDVSVGFFAVLLPGFCLWIAYGLARSDWALVIPNVVALLVGAVTIGIATLLRRSLRLRPSRGRRSSERPGSERRRGAPVTR